MIKTVAKIYTFIEFEGETQMHDSWETVQGDKALIARIEKVAVDCKYAAKDADGRRVTLKNGELISW